MNPRSTRILAVVVAILTIGSAYGVYYAAARAVAAANCPAVSSNPFLLDSPETADSVDPTVTFTVPGWSIDQNVYQTLVMYNGSSETNFVGELAKNWTSSSGGTIWTFNLWPGEHFSNGDPINAYVVWYSFYRSLLVNQPDVFLVEENFWVPGANYYSPLAVTQASNNSLNATLNTFVNVSTVTNPAPSVLTAMHATGQSFRVISNLTIQVIIGAGYLAISTYAFILDQLATVAFAVVDPIWIHQNGGVQLGKGNAYSATHALGSGPYVLSYYAENGGWELTPNTNYWGTALAQQEPWNTIIQPALHSVQVNIQADPAVVVSNLQTGTIASGDFGYVGPSTLAPIKSSPCITVKAAPVVYGSTAGAWWVYMNRNVAPFNSIYVRAAIVHAINYAQVINEAFGGPESASQWVGPVPPGFPDYNPAGLAPYQYNLTLAWSEMNSSPWPYNPKTGAGGYPGTLNFEFVNSGDFPVVALLLQADLGQIGIRVQIVGMSYNQLILEQSLDLTTGLCTSTESINGGPYPIGLNFYSADYVAPDDATQLDALSYGFYNMCMSEYATKTMDSLVLQAAGQLNATLRSQEYAQETSIMYGDYTNAWLVVPTFYQVYNNHLAGLVPNAMGSSIPASFEYNTYYST